MSQITIQVNVAISPETLAALEAVALAMMKALRPIAAAAGGGPEGLPDAPAAIPAAAAAPAPLGGGADGMLAEADDDGDLAPVAEKAIPEQIIPPLAVEDFRSSWSTAREVLMTRMKAEWKSWAEITAAINKLPGREVSIKAAQVRYGVMKAQGKLPIVPVVTEPSVARMLEAHAAKNANVAATDWQAIADWARFNKVDIEGMAQAAALKKINAARAQFELPPFVVTRAFGPVEALPDPKTGNVSYETIARETKLKFARRTA